MAKKGSKPIPSSQAEIGNLVPGDKPVIARQYKFDQFIRNVEEGADDHSILVLKSASLKGLNGKGTILLLDFAKDQTVWDFDIRRFNIAYSKDVFVYSSVEGNLFFSKATGEKLYQKKNETSLIERPENMGFTFVDAPHNMLYSQTMDATDMLDGKLKWKSAAVTKYGWDYVYEKNDSTFYLAAGGVHAFNRRTGAGWHYDLAQGIHDQAWSVKKDQIGSFGVWSESTGFMNEPTVVSGLGSNLLYDSLSHRIYYASPDKLVCLDEQGHLVWDYKLLPEVASKSLIIKSGDRIILLSRGFAFFNGGVVKSGNCFLASFNAATGRRNYFNRIEADYIRQAAYEKDTITMVTADRLIRFNTIDGSLLKTVKSDSFANIIVFLKDVSKFLISDNAGSFGELAGSGMYNYLLGPDGLLHKLDSSLLKTTAIPKLNIWEKKERYGPLQIISSWDRIAILRNGKLLLQPHVLGTAKLMGDNLVIRSGKSIYVMDMKQLL